MEPCPNCGSQDITLNTQNNNRCLYCGFIFNAINSPNNPDQQSFQTSADDRGISLEKRSIGRISNNNDGTIYNEHQITTQQNDQIVKTSIREFRESGQLIFHSDDEAVAVCSCGNLIHKDGLSRCAFGREPLFGACARTLGDRTYCAKAYWFIRITSGIFSIIKFFLFIIGQVLSLVFLKD